MMSSPPFQATLPSQVCTLVVLPDANAITLFRHLGRALRASDPRLPDPLDPGIEYGSLRDPFLPYTPTPRVSNLVATIRIVERNDAVRLASDSVHEWLLGGGISFPLRLVTTKARLFNYISTDAIEAALGVRAEVSDHSDVPLQTAQALHVQAAGPAWHQLSPEEQRKKIQRAEILLCEVVGPVITPAMLAERRAKSDIGLWLYAIQQALPRRVLSTPL